MEVVGLAVFLAASASIVVIVDRIRDIVNTSPVVTNVIAIVVGLGWAFAGDIGATAALAEAVGLDLAYEVPHVLDVGLTGLALGLSAGYLSDLRPKKDTEKILVTADEA